MLSLNRFHIPTLGQDLLTRILIWTASLLMLFNELLVLARIQYLQNSAVIAYKSQSSGTSEVRA